MRILRAFLFAVAISGCSATVDGSAAPAAPLAMDPGKPATADSPYTVEILGDSGGVLQTFDAGGKFYVLGEEGGRYQIHITNPTAARIEAVVTVDGLDVVDGEDGDLHKRGYVVPAGGDLTIEGFRTSTSEVATFRFSSVDGSYAGRKGKARNVGVIGVALFTEAAPVEIIAPDVPAEPTYTYDKDVRPDYGSEEGAGDSGGAGPSGADRPATKRSGGSAGAPRYRRPPPPDDDGEVEVTEEDVYRPDPDPCCQKTHRGGLGTEYGEQRQSAATWTQFVRSSDTPAAVAEIRYNDAGGLAALGIVPGEATATPSEITLRETADPFPGFAEPPK